MNSHKPFLVVAFFVSCFLFQVHGQNKAFYKGKISSVEYVSSMASRPNDLTPADNSVREAKDKRSLPPELFKSSDPRNGDDPLVKNKAKSAQSAALAPPSLVFDAYSSNSSPTDPSLAIGPNHVFVVYNTGFTIYDKSGNQLLGQTAPNPAIFPSGGCCDLTVSYDNAADRWVLSFLGSGAQIAVSDGPDPLTSGWYVYNIGAINDYQKLSVWSDGYYITDNNGGSNKVWALERDAMLVGDPNAQILGFDLPGLARSGFFSPQALNVTDSNLPAPGGATIVFLQDNAYAGISEDHVKVWTIDVDWNNASNSTISNPEEIVTTPFVSVFDNGSFSNLQQPGGVLIDAIQATIMNQAQFRKFPTHNSAIFNFVVDVEGGPGKLAGIRWYEFRQSGDNQPWSLYQEGTYTSPDGKHAWMASMAMDGQGNIGMGYTAMSGPTTSSTVRVSSYFTGRLSSDPLGVMTGTEQLIASGNGNLPNVRYGDYSKVDVDPTDDTSFWFINEYVNSGRRGVVGKFTIEEGEPDNEPPTTPTDLAFSNITPTGALLSWTASTDNVGVASYTIAVDGNQVGTSTNTSFALTGLAPLTTYSISVVATDPSGNVSGSATASLTTLDGSAVTYCDSASTNVNDEFISRVQLNTIDNTSGPLVYSDFTGISTVLNEGQTYTITVTPTWTGTIFAEAYAVWIDYNNNGDFTDAGELVFSKAPSTDPTNSGTFTVPNGTSQTSVRMRVSMKYNDIPDPCETFQFGEVEDYTINLEMGTGGDPGGEGVIAAYFFETGLEGWSDPGSDCARVNSSNSFEGDFSIRLRDDSSTSNSVSPVLDLSGQNVVTFEFHTRAVSMENGEDFFIEFFNGSSFQVIGQYIAGTDFTNNSFFTDTITLTSSEFGFNTGNRFRIRCDASSNGDRVYFDQLVISGDNVSQSATNTVRNADEAVALRTFTEEANNQINLFPNPVNSNLTIEVSNGNFDEIIMISTKGEVVKKIVPTSDVLSVDVSQMAVGMYFLRFVSDGFAITKRFIKD